MKSRIFLLVFASLIATGCGSEPESTASQSSELVGIDTSKSSAAQVQEISDNIATADEYAAAFQRYSSCLNAAGFELHDVDTSQAVYKFSIPGPAVESGVDDDCYISEFKFVDILWQTTEENENNSETARIIRNCLREQGITPAEERDALSSQLRELNFDINDCNEINPN